MARGGLKYQGTHQWQVPRPPPRRLPSGSDSDSVKSGTSDWQEKNGFMRWWNLLALSMAAVTCSPP